MVLDMSLFTNRVIEIGKDATERSGVKAGDIIVLGNEPTATYRLHGIMISETRIFNVVGRIPDQEFHQSYIWMISGRVDREIKSVEDLKKIENPTEGMRVRVVEQLKRKIYSYQKKKWNLDKTITVPGMRKLESNGK